MVTVPDPADHTDVRAALAACRADDPDVVLVVGSGDLADAVDRAASHVVHQRRRDDPPPVVPGGATVLDAITGPSWEVAVVVAAGRPAPDLPRLRMLHRIRELAEQADLARANVAGTTTALRACTDERDGLRRRLDELDAEVEGLVAEARDRRAVLRSLLDELAAG